MEGPWSGGALEAGDGHCPWDTQATPLELKRTTIPKSDAWVLPEEGGEGLDEDISLIHLHSFIQEILTVDLLCLHRQPGRQGSFPDLLHHLQGPRVSAFPIPSWEEERALPCWSFHRRGFSTHTEASGLAALVSPPQVSSRWGISTKEVG